MTFCAFRLTRDPSGESAEKQPRLVVSISVAHDRPSVRVAFVTWRAHRACRALSAYRSSRLYRERMFGRCAGSSMGSRFKRNLSVNASREPCAVFCISKRIQKCGVKHERSLGRHEQGSQQIGGAALPRRANGRVIRSAHLPRSPERTKGRLLPGLVRLRVSLFHERSP